MQHKGRDGPRQDADVHEKYKPPYQFSTHIGAACARQMKTFHDLAEKLKMPVEDVMRQCNREDSSVQTLGKGVGEGTGD